MFGSVLVSVLQEQEALYHNYLLSREENRNNLHINIDHVVDYFRAHKIQEDMMHKNKTSAEKKRYNKRFVYF
jgi:hypothetical protein